VVRIAVRPGTSTIYPSYRMTIFDQPPNRAGLTTREIAVECRKGETGDQVAVVIARAIFDYLQGQPPVRASLVLNTDPILALTTVVPLPPAPAPSEPEAEPLVS